MSKLLIIGDAHLKATRMELVTQFLSWLDSVYEQVNPDIIVFTGDYFDNHSIIRCEIMSMFSAHIRKHPKILKYYILGNHDQFKPNDSRYHALQPMKGVHDHFVVVDEITEIDGITIVPFIHDLNQFPLKTQPICLAHQTFIGADYGYTKADAGVDADKVSADIIISGHVHGRQTFGKVIYPGSPYSQSVNDIDQSKGVMIFDTDTYKYSYIDCPLPSWRGIKFELNEAYSATDMHQDIEAQIDSLNHWVLDITGPKAEVVSYLDSKQFLAMKKGKKLVTRASHTDTLKERVKIQAITMDDIISSYVSEVYKGALDKTTVISKALEIKNKVSV